MHVPPIMPANTICKTHRVYNSFSAGSVRRLSHLWQKLVLVVYKGAPIAMLGFDYQLIVGFRGGAPRLVCRVPESLHGPDRPPDHKTQRRISRGPV